MANKVFNFGKNQSYDTNLLKISYKDISMLSSPRIKMSKQTFNIASAIDVEAVKIAMRNLFTFIPGERILDPDFGNTVMKYLYSGINEYTKEQIVAEIQKMVSTYEPRAKIDSLEDVSSIVDHENNTIQIKIVWHVIGLDDTKYTLMLGA